MNSLKSLQLTHYKGFAKHRISLQNPSVLIGANNAGKSTALEALRVVAAAIPDAKRRRQDTGATLAGRDFSAWRTPKAALAVAGFSAENLRHNFEDRETSIVAQFTSGAEFAIVWPASEADDRIELPSSILIPGPHYAVKSFQSAAKEQLPDIAIVPQLTPLEQVETVVSRETLRETLQSRRSSRHFRNYLLNLDKEEWQEFSTFATKHTPEIKSLSRSQSTAGANIYFTEGPRSQEREIVWAGDGLQIWIQVLFHYWRAHKSEILLLDEPDVFLHPDLQRRLAQLVFSRDDQQVVIATHSVEILSTAESGKAILVDRGRSTSKRLRSPSYLEEAGRALGSGFELGLGRALRSGRVLFVEGQDFKILSLAARACKFENAASASAFAVVPLGGFTRSAMASAFKEALERLESQVRVMVILDSDLKSSFQLDLECESLKKAGVILHIWRWRELENYLVTPESISQVSKLPVEAVRELSEEVRLSLKTEAQNEFTAVRLSEASLAGSPLVGRAPKTILETTIAEFEALWVAPEGPTSLIDAKRFISQMNQELQRRKVRTITATGLAKRLTREVANDDLIRGLSELDEFARSAS